MKRSRIKSKPLNRVDRFVRRLKNHRVVAILVFAGLAIVAIAQVTNSLTHLSLWLGHWRVQSIPASTQKDSRRWITWHDDEDKFKNLVVLHRGRFGSAFSDFWSAAALQNDTDVPMCFSVWRDQTNEWRIFVLQPSQTKAFTAHFEPIFIKIRGEIIAYDDDPDNLVATNDNEDIFELDFETFEREPNATELRQLSPNMFKKIMGSDPVRLNDNIQVFASILGSKGGQIQTCNCNEGFEHEIATVDTDVPVIRLRRAQ